MARAAAMPTPLPFDVRLTLAGANALIAVLSVAIAGSVLWWALRLPLFQLRGIVLEGEPAHHTARTVRAQLAGKLAGSFFTVDLDRARVAFEAVPWVRRATVRRLWPNQLAVRIEEHKTAALWAADDGNDRLVNTYGEVFEANLAEVEDDELPRLAGPAGSSARMLAAYRALAPALAPLEERIVTLRLSGRGSWRLVLADGVVIELGRGEPHELAARAGAFVRTLPQVRAAYQRPLLRADLRHPDGYALRLKGVTTTLAPGVAVPAR
jgi:cell division protein FtsQ